MANDSGIRGKLKIATEVLTNFSEKHGKVILVLLILIPMLLSMHFRVQSAYLPVTDNWARQSVNNAVRNTLQQQVNQQYPNLPAAQKSELVNQQFQRALNEQRGQIQSQIETTSRQFKSRLQDDDGQTYLLAIDPYQWYRWYLNSIETGHQYDTLKDGQPWNNHKLAPLGITHTDSMHVTFAYWIFLLVSLLNSNIPPLTVFFYIPVIFSALAVIPAFFIARKKTGDLGGFMAATLLAVHPSFLGRTAAGFSDTDPYNVLFPLLITWIFIEAFEATDLKKRISLALLAGFTTGLFSAVWGGWWYIFDFLVVVILIYLLYVIVKEYVSSGTVKNVFTSSTVRSSITTGLLYAVSSGIFTSLFTSFKNFISAPINPLSFRLIKQAAHENLWPNVMTTVAELGEVGLQGIVSQMGGKLLFFLALLGIVFTMLREGNWNKKDWGLLGASFILLLLLISDKFLGMEQLTYLFLLGIPVAIGLLLTLKDDREVDVKYALVFTIWFIGTIYATTKGTRFTLLLIPAFAVAFGISAGMIQKVAVRWMEKSLNLSGNWTSPLVSVLLLLLLMAPLQTAANAAKGEVPSMNDAWWASLEQIKEESEPDAIINSWWDFGHWFKAIADRAVTFDGGSQNTPMAHWIGNTLLTDDEDTAVGILRMLDCGSNTAFEVVSNATSDVEGSVDLLYEVIVMDEEGARQRIREERLSDEVAERVLSLTHCEPPENYFITSQDMVGKAGVWAHFGSWNFERAYIYNNLRRDAPEEAIAYMEENFGYDREQAQNLYYDANALKSEDAANSWIAPWPRYITGSWQRCSRQQNDTLIVCNLGVSIGQQSGQHNVVEQIFVNATDTRESYMTFGVYDGNTGQRLGGADGRPDIFAFAGEELEVFEMENSTFPYAVLIDTLSENPRALLMDKKFVGSTFTNLFYLNGRYMEHFDVFSDRTGVNGQRIIVWKVDWDGKEG